MNVSRILGALSLSVLLCAPAWAQNASIQGTVSDSSGAVLPGVTVEASSAALIERTKSVVTDGSGAYRIIDLRPGAYSMTFTLAGFQIARRENIVLTTGFTATINATLQVGSLDESVTVTGAAPTVDTVNTRVSRSSIKRLSKRSPSPRTPAPSRT
jgi:hypothetical protein